MQRIDQPQSQESKENVDQIEGSRQSGASSASTAVKLGSCVCSSGLLDGMPKTPGKGGGSGKFDTVTSSRCQIRIVHSDVCQAVTKTGDVNVELPEGEFTDGKLGLVDPDILKERLANVGEGKLYEDPDFPPDGFSLSFTNPNDPNFDSVTWMRPHELCEDPHIFVDGPSRIDVKQGCLGDCWFLSACASLARTPSLIERVIHPAQPLSGPGYQGVVTVNLWRFGDWVTVHIDDRLPTQNGALMYASSTEPREFWVAFIEKAYAKIQGCYEGLSGGDPLDAFVDLTGGLAETVTLANIPFRRLRVIYEQGSFVACSREGDSLANPTDKRTGLVEGHAYSVSGVAKLNPTNSNELQLVRVHNPWAGQEWKGAWSDGDPRWNNLDSETKNALNVINREDGEFWMDYKDFQDHFQFITVATLGPEFKQGGSSEAAGKVKKVLGKWIAGDNAGGSRNDIKQFATNPQYLVKLTDPDDRYTDDDDNSKCSILVGLMQEHRRSERDKELRIRSIAFFVYKTDSPNERLSAEYLSTTKDQGSSNVFVNSREVIGRFHLDPGYYIIIPATYTPNETRSFLLRIFALKPLEVRKHSNQEFLMHKQDAFVEDITKWIKCI